jgi:bifunctional N-acetylglucosamine-1-phosphate-uridyltransferase/glucosamine-1-phosphate-acetyltransferase GlmU-like protein
MIYISDFIKTFTDHFETQQQEPWQMISNISSIVSDQIAKLNDDFIVKDNVAIHRTAVVEQNVMIKPPAIINADCFIGANAYLRGGIYLAAHVKIGTGCEIKSSFVFEGSAVAHFNFIGDSMIGSNVNFEAGSITANHFNERIDKEITVFFNGKSIKTGATKFGALVADNCKIGANAVLSPGTILLPGTIVKRLELIDQSNNAPNP